MPNFATRTDLLEQTNVHKLAQYSVPTDKPMPDDDVLRVAIEGGDLGEFTEHDNDLAALALKNIDRALLDATDLMVSYGIPADAEKPLLTRYCSQIAIYLLAVMQDSVSESLQATYNGIIKQLEKHSRKEINLVRDETGEPITGDVIEITSNRQRYIPNGSGADLDEF